MSETKVASGFKAVSGFKTEKMLSFTLEPSGYTDLGGVRVEPDLVLTQMRYLTNLVSNLATGLAKTHFNPTDLTLLHVRSLEKPVYEDRHDPEGEYLPDGLRAKKRVKILPGFPAKAHVAAAVLGSEWFPSVETAQDMSGVYLPNRGIRMATEWTIRTLRATARRFLITQALLDYTKSGNSVESALTFLEETYEITVERAELQNRQRAIRNWIKKYGQAPESMCNMETPPVCENILLAAATDKQWQHMTRAGRQLVWEFKLPTKAKPQNKNDYQRIRVNFHLPVYISQDCPVHTPTVRITPTKDDSLKILLDVTYGVAFVEPLTRSKRNHAPALASDWGTISTLTAIAGHKSKTGKLVIDSQPVFFSVKTIAKKLKRLKKQQDALMSKIGHWRTLMVNCFDTETLQQLEKLIKRAELERRLINEKRGNINQHLGHIAAIWLIRQALATGAKTIYIENLRSLAFDTQNYVPWAEVVTDALRGKIFAYLQDWCDRLGIKLVEVPPAYTSSTCSHCTDGTMEFYKHSDLAEKGHVWAHCPTCGYTAHRDYNAAINILSQGLFGKTLKPFRPVSEFSKKYVASRGKGPSHAGPKPAAKSRTKTGVTAKQSKTGRKKHTLAKRDQRRNTMLTKQGKETSKNLTVSKAYKHPSLWRLLGDNYSSGTGHVTQVEAGGMYPHVTPTHLHPLQT